MTDSHRISGLLLLLLSFGLLTGCAGVVVGGAATGAAVIHDRRSAGQVIDDQGLDWKVSQAIYEEKEVSNASHINVTVYNGVVLLTGEAPTEDLKLRANAIAAKASDNSKIHNELVIANTTSLSSRTNDAYITAKVKTVMLEIDDIPNFDPTRVKVTTEDSVVFLMGLLTQQEADAVTDKVRNVSGVKKVVRLFEYL